MAWRSTSSTSISSRLSEPGAGVGLTAAQVSGWAASLYVAGACIAESLENIAKPLTVEDSPKGPAVPAPAG